MKFNSHFGFVTVLSLALLPWHAAPATAFLSELERMITPRAFQPSPDLKKFSKEPLLPDNNSNAAFDIRLDIASSSVSSSGSHNRNHDDNAPPRMSIHGLTLQLLQDAVTDTKLSPAIRMPGFHGPHPDISSGIKRIDVQRPGHFIDMTGKNVIHLMNGCWEMIWRYDAPAGCIICGFDLPHDVVRVGTSASAAAPAIAAGRLYFSFPIWKRTTLLEYQEKKAQVLSRTKELLQERDEELLKMGQTNNLLRKAMHYRNAAAAVERWSLYPVHSYQANIPDMADVFEIGTANDDDKNTLFMTKQGTVWTKPGIPGGSSTTGNGNNNHHFLSPIHLGGNFFGGGGGGSVNGKQILLGTALIRKCNLVNENAKPNGMRGGNDDNDHTRRHGTSSSSSSLSKLAP